MDLWRVLLLLLGLGILYNTAVQFIQEQLPDHNGVTSLLVVGGVLWTVCGAALIIGVDDAFTVLLCFVASGTPMIAGSIMRYVDGRERAR